MHAPRERICEVKVFCLGTTTERKGIERLLPASVPTDRPLLCVEINPPRGTDIEAVIQRYATVQGIDFVNITDSALAKMKFSSLAFASIIKQRLGLEPLVNLSCRDRNVIALQSELLGAWALGVRSIIALTGDAMTVGDLPDAKGVFEVNSIGLLNLVGSLNGGKDLAGAELKGHPSYTCGVVVNPNARNSAAEIKRLARKKDAGAVYALSQPVFDPEQAHSFFKAAAEVGIDMFVGLLPFKSVQSFEGIAKVPGIRIPDSVVERVKSVPAEQVAETSMDVALQVAEASAPFVRGFHVISGGTPLLGLDLCKRVSDWIGRK
jgi:5,10-methylenetetrahydrofolate reductase